MQAFVGSNAGSVTSFEHVARRPVHQKGMEGASLKATCCFPLDRAKQGKCAGYPRLCEGSGCYSWPGPNLDPESRTQFPMELARKSVGADSLRFCLHLPAVIYSPLNGCSNFGHAHEPPKVVLRHAFPTGWHLLVSKGGSLDCLLDQ